MSEQSTGVTERVEEYIDDLRHNSERRSDASFDTDTADQIADELESMLELPEDVEKTPLEEWEEHNESFSYDPPEKPAEAWSSEEYTELYDRVIRREVQWFCDKCTGRGPIGTLEKARRHVEGHNDDLVEQYATPRDEQDTATDGGTSESRVAERREENQSLGDFGPSGTEPERSGRAE